MQAGGRRRKTVEINLEGFSMLEMERGDEDTETRRILAKRMQRRRQQEEEDDWLDESFNMSTLTYSSSPTRPAAIRTPLRQLNHQNAATTVKTPQKRAAELWNHMVENM